jgi:hypothetical protein
MRDTHEKIVVRGASFHFRSLHPPDGRRAIIDVEEYTIDRMMTITLAAIAGLRHHEKASMEVVI